MRPGGDATLTELPGPGRLATDGGRIVSNVSASEEPVLFLAIDHRNSVEKNLYKLTSPDPDTEATEVRITVDKLLVYEALLDAVPQLPEGVRAGIRSTRNTAPRSRELAGRAKDEVSLAMPVEASGKEWLEFAYGDDWVRHAEFFATDYPKVLVRDNPGFEPEQRAQQAGRLAEISKWATATGRRLLIELIVPATPAEDQAAGSERRYDDRQRPADTVAAIEYLQDRGVDPAIWKVEGLDQRDDVVKIVETARRGGRRPTASCSGGTRRKRTSIAGSA